MASFGSDHAAIRAAVDVGPEGIARSLRIYNERLSLPKPLAVATTENAFRRSVGNVLVQLDTRLAGAPQPDPAPQADRGDQRPAKRFKGAAPEATALLAGAPQPDPAQPDPAPQADRDDQQPAADATARVVARLIKLRNGLVAFCAEIKRITAGHFDPVPQLQRLIRGELRGPEIDAFITQCYVVPHPRLSARVKAQLGELEQVRVDLGAARRSASAPAAPQPDPAPQAGAPDDTAPQADPVNPITGGDPWMGGAASTLQAESTAAAMPEAVQVLDGELQPALKRKRSTGCECTNALQSRECALCLEYRASMADRQRKYNQKNRDKKKAERDGTPPPPPAEGRAACVPVRGDLSVTYAHKMTLERRRAATKACRAKLGRGPRAKPPAGALQDAELLLGIATPQRTAGLDRPAFEAHLHTLRAVLGPGEAPQ